MSEQRTSYSTGPIPATWRDGLDERMRKAIAFAETYVSDFGHGAIGHNDYILIARLAELLDVAVGVKELPKPPSPAEIRLTFGKHSGRTLGELVDLDIGYLDWLAREARDESLRRAVAAVLATPSEAPDEQEHDSSDLPF
jgi:hypothetical protein